MKSPLNRETLTKIRAMLDLIEVTNDPGAECKLWVSDDYVSVEVSSANLPINDVRLVVGASPLEVDQVAEIHERKLAARRNALRGDW